MSSPMSFHDLGLDELRHVCSFLSPKDMCFLAISSRRTRELAHEVKNSNTALPMQLACRGYLLGAIPISPWIFYCCLSNSFAADCRSSTGRQPARGSSEARFTTVCNTRTCLLSKSGSRPPHSMSYTRFIFLHALYSG